MGIGLLAWQVVLMRQMTPPGASIGEAGRLVLGQTRWGALWLARQGFLFAVCSVLFWQIRRWPGKTAGRLSWLVASGVLALLTVQSLTGHAAGADHSPQLAIVVDVLHLLAACIWLGGLAALLVALLVFWQQNRASFLRLAGEAGRAFSPLAALSVGVLIATGLYSMGRQVASPDALVTTLYGQALAGKVGLVLIAGTFGLGNALLLHPTLAQPLARRLGRAPGRTLLSSNRLPQLLVAEALLGLAVLLATGLITATPPPRGPEFTVAAEEIPATLSQAADDLVVTLAVKPNRPGPNVFTILSASTLRPPPAIVLRVLVHFSRREGEAELVTTVAHELEPGRYLLMGDYLTQAGPWQVEVAIQRDGLPDAVARFPWVVAPPGTARPLVLSKQSFTTLLTLAAAGALLLVALAVGVMHRRITLVQGGSNS
ncbi:MAG: hypothetical protein DCC55_18605 [Chloroflexi bacterium]|nr:MAG: hypothetical protein DCC55_18605 [Chloroflexota bacterium]